MQFLIAGSSIIVLFLMPFIFAIMQKLMRVKTKRKEEQALKGIVSGIGQWLHAAYPGSKWRWVCCPAGFAINGGIARIEVILVSGEQQFMDVCLSVSGYMALHVVNATELTAAEIVSGPADGENSDENNVDEHALPSIDAASSAASATVKLHDEETVGKWYNIVFINSLATLIDDLNASGEVYLYIGAGGKAYTENGGNTAVVCDFGEMPDPALWDFITERLGEEGLFAETQDDERIFISWA